jgi:hypothetical protein
MICIPVRPSSLLSVHFFFSLLSLSRCFFLLFCSSPGCVSALKMKSDVSTEAVSDWVVSDKLGRVMFVVSHVRRERENCQAGKQPTRLHA